MSEGTDLPGDGAVSDIGSSFRLFTPRRQTSLPSLVPKPQLLSSPHLPSWTEPRQRLTAAILHSPAVLEAFHRSNLSNTDSAKLNHEEKDDNSDIETSTEAPIVENKCHTTVEAHGRNNSFDGHISVSDKNNHRTSESSLDTLERQIIVSDHVEKDFQTEMDASNIRLESSEDCSPRLNLRDSPVSCSDHKQKPASCPSRVHTSSFGSNCSGDDSLISVQSRCPMCDGCSSNGSSTFSQQTHTSHQTMDFTSRQSMDFIDTCWPGDGRSCRGLKLGGQTVDKTLLGGSQPDVHMAGDVETRLGPDDMDSLLHTPCGCREEGVDHPRQTASRCASLTNDEFIILLLRIHLSRYKTMMEELSEQKRISKSQSKTMACMIQTVVVLTQRHHTAQDTCRKLLAEVHRFQSERRAHALHRRRMFICLSVMVCLHLLNIHAVRTKLLSLIRFFGVFEIAKKINRTRKMVAENWRSIPSMLTDFWRIFIFGSRSRLLTNCSP